MQEKLEASLVGRMLISAFVIVTVGSMIVWNMPGSKLRDEGMRLARPYIAATALDQNWSVFAPDPFRETFGLEARITYADGTHGTWRVPHGNAVIGALWDVRWGKWEEQVLRPYHAELCKPTADYIANRELEAKRHPTQIELVRRWYVLNPPGQKPSHGPWQEQVFCTTRITNGAGKL